MTEWEQMKNEYRDVQIPANGPHQMLETIAKAKRDRKRSRLKQAARYSTVVAAVLLVVLLIPGIALFSGGFSMGNEETAQESQMNCTASTGSGQESAKSDSAANAGSADYNTNSMASVTSQNKTTASDENMKYERPEYSANDGGNTEESMEEGAELEDTRDKLVGVAAPEASENYADSEDRQPVNELTAVLSEVQKLALCKEISRQMEECRQQGEKYDTMYDTFMEEVLSEARDYYIREDGLLVIVYAAGVLAPESQGEISFVIPKEIIDIEETR